MKNTVLVFAALFLFSTLSIAQEKKKDTHKMECCAMKHGKMVCMKDGKEVPMDKEMKMNGMIVMPDGSCKMSNGKVVKLKEGQCCDKDGKIHNDCKD